MTEGRGDNLTSQITLVNPAEPFNSTGMFPYRPHRCFAESNPTGALLVLLNNFFGRQFNSLNDAAYHKGTGDLFFTDVDYGYVRCATKSRWQNL